MTLSTTQAKYTQSCVKIHYDSQSIIHLANHQFYRERTKHIDIRLHFVRDMIESREIVVEKVVAEDNREACGVICGCLGGQCHPQGVFFACLINKFHGLSNVNRSG